MPHRDLDERETRPAGQRGRHLHGHHPRDQTRSTGRGFVRRPQRRPTRLTLKWNAVPDATSYTVAYWKGSASAPESEYAYKTGIASTATSQELTNLESNTSYWAKVKAVGSLDSDWSETANATTMDSGGEPLLPTADLLDVVFRNDGSAMDNSSSATPVRRMPVIEAVKAKGLTDRVEYIAFDYTTCKRIVNALPGAMVQYLNGDLAPAAVRQDGIGGIDYRFSAYSGNPGWVKEGTCQRHGHERMDGRHGAGHDDLHRMGEWISSPPTTPRP